MRLFKNNFFKKMSIYLVGTFSTYLINILLVPLYAYFVSTEELGEYDYLLSVSNMITPIVFFVLWESILKYCLGKDKDNFTNYFSTAFIFGGFGCIACAAVMGCLIPFNLKINLPLLFLLIIVQGLVSLWQYSARAMGETKQYVISGIAGSVALILLDLFFAFCLRLDYIGLTISRITSLLITIVVLEFKTKLLSKIRFQLFSKTKLKQMLLFSAPLVVNTVALWFYSGGNRIIIRDLIGASENGLYSFAAKFSVLISFCSTIVSMAVIEEAYSYNSIDEYRVKIGRLISMISKAYFSMILLAIPAINILYQFAFKQTAYYESSVFVLPLLLSALFTALANNYGSSFQVTDKTKYIFITTLVGAIISLAISLGFIGVLGIWSVVIGNIIGPFVMMLLRAIYAKKVTQLSINWTINIVLFATSVLSSIIINVFSSLFITACIFVVCVLLVFILYRKELMGTVGSLRRKK